MFCCKAEAMPVCVGNGEPLRIGVVAAFLYIGIRNKLFCNGAGVAANARAVFPVAVRFILASAIPCNLVECQRHLQEHSEVRHIAIFRAAQHLHRYRNTAIPIELIGDQTAVVRILWECVTGDNVHRVSRLLARYDRRNGIQRSDFPHCGIVRHPAAQIIFNRSTPEVRSWNANLRGNAFHAVFLIGNNACFIPAEQDVEIRTVNAIVDIAHNQFRSGQQFFGRWNNHVPSSLSKCNFCLCICPVGCSGSVDGNGQRVSSWFCCSSSKRICKRLCSLRSNDRQRQFLFCNRNAILAERCSHRIRSRIREQEFVVNGEALRCAGNRKWLIAVLHFCHFGGKGAVCKDNAIRAEIIVCRTVVKIAACCKE